MKTKTYFKIQWICIIIQILFWFPMIYAENNTMFYLFFSLDVGIFGIIMGTLGIKKSKRRLKWKGNPNIEENHRHDYRWIKDNDERAEWIKKHWELKHGE